MPQLFPSAFLKSGLAKMVKDNYHIRVGKTIQIFAFLTAVFGKPGDERDAKRMRKIRRASDEWHPRVLLVRNPLLTGDLAQVTTTSGFDYYFCGMMAAETVSIP